MINTAGLICKVASLSDLDHLLQLSKASFHYEIEKLGQGPPGFDSAAYYETAITKHHTFKLLDASLTIIGGAVVKQLDDGSLYLSRFFITPGLQGKGYGTFLLKSIENFFSGTQHWFLHAAAALDKVVEFYVKSGYVVFKQEEINNISFFMLKKQVIEKTSLFIQFTGTQSTGKTSLATYIQNNFDMLGIQFVRIQEISRELLRSGIVSSIDSSASHYSQLALNSELQLRYLEAIINHPVKTLIISERSPICCLGYTKALTAGENSYLVSSSEKFIKLSQEANIKTLYFPPVIPFTEDGVRNSQSREIVDKEILQTLIDTNTPFIAVDSADFASRCKLVTNIISHHFLESSIL